jgi:type II secretion system protein C
MTMAALLVALCLVLTPMGAEQVDSRILAQAKLKKVRVNFEGAKLVRVVKWVTKITGKNFIVEDSLRDRKITILSGTSVTVDEAYQAFLDALEAEGLRVETAGKFLKITRGRHHRLHSPRADISMGDCPTPIGIAKTGDYSYKIEREALEGWFDNPACLGRQARIVPYMQDGVVTGFKLFAIRPNTLYSKLGFKNGDVILEINGVKMTNPKDALKVYQEVKDAKTVSIEILRRGKPKALKIEIE